MSRLTKLTAVTTALCLAMGAPALAQGKGKTHGDARSKHKVHQVQARGLACPPGLAKKSPACVPPGQSKKHQRSEDGQVREARIRIGTRLDGLDYRVVKPWQYGLEPAPRGSRYAIYDNVLVRIDSETAEVLDLIRAVRAVAN